MMYSFFRLYPKELLFLGPILVLGIFLWFVLDSQDRASVEANQRAKANFVAVDTLHHMNERLGRKALLLSRLTTAAQILPELDAVTFERIASEIAFDVHLQISNDLIRRLEIISVSYAADFVVNHVYPLRSNLDLLDFDYLNLTGQSGNLEEVLETFSPFMSNPYEDLQEKAAIAIRQVARNNRGEPIGLASVAIDFETFLGYFKDRAMQLHDYHLVLDLAESETTGFNLTNWNDAETLSFENYGLNWSISVSPAGGWSAPPILTPTKIGVAIATLILLLASHFRFMSQLRSRQVVERLEKGIDALSAGFVIYDKDGRLLHWNETYSSLFGYKDMLKVGMTFEDVLREGFAKNLFRVPEHDRENWIKEALTRHRLTNEAIEVELNNGKWVRAISCLTNDGDRVGVRFDVTDIKKAQINAEAASVAKSEFINLISHELRTPLTVILGFGRLLKLRYMNTGQNEDDTFAYDAINRVVLAGEGLLTLINNMLDYTKLRSGTLNQNKSTFELSEILSAAIDRITPLATERSVSIKTDLVSKLVNADPAQVRQILEHLVKNAVQFTPPGTTVNVYVEIAPEAVEITVSDKGPGIPPEKLDEVFHEFSQLQPTSTRQHGGTGLGLALSKRLAVLQGGDLLVRSTLGQGSSFTLRLPKTEISASYDAMGIIGLSTRGARND